MRVLPFEIPERQCTYLREHHFHSARGLFRPARLQPQTTGGHLPPRGAPPRLGGGEQCAPHGAARLETQPPRHRGVGRTEPRAAV